MITFCYCYYASYFAFLMIDNTSIYYIFIHNEMLMLFIFTIDIFYAYFFIIVLHCYLWGPTISTVVVLYTWLLCLVRFITFIVSIMKFIHSSFIKLTHIVVYNFNIYGPRSSEVQNESQNSHRDLMAFMRNVQEFLALLVWISLIFCAITLLQCVSILNFLLLAFCTFQFR